MNEGVFPQRRVLVLIAPGVLSLDAYGPLESFFFAGRIMAQRLAGLPEDVTSPVQDHALHYHVELVALEAGLVPTLSGSQLVASLASRDVTTPFDTLIVAGGDLRAIAAELHPHSRLTAEVQRLAALARRVAATCTGTFLLGVAGLLHGKSATTHWAACDIMRGVFPQVIVKHEPIYVQDGNVYTSAGGTTNMDLALAMIAEDHGPALAQDVARMLVLYVRRSANHHQLSAPLVCQDADRAPLRELQRWIIEHPDVDLSVTALAARVGMSVRNFSRAFRRELGMTPAAYVEAIRVGAATRKLEQSEASVEQVALAVGFGSAQALRRSFRRRNGQAPSEVRRSARV
jgi:transcriptional regulator GlxA family with amidase domain